MATYSAKTTASKPSFASIAAMAPPTQNGPTIIGRENETPSALLSSTRISKAPLAGSSPSAQLHRDLQNSMSRLAVREPPLPTRPLNDQQKNNISRAGLRFYDDQTHVSASSTKPASLDGKSTTSGTTFALDEKESLRPDDSASVKAAEEEDFGSGPASGAQNSRVGSEAGSRAFRDQFHEISESIGSGNHRMQSLGSRRVITGIEEEAPQITRSPLVSTMPAPTVSTPQLIATNGSPMDYQYQKPDEKLLEALQSPKDRFFLLRLERDVIAFVRDSTDPMIDLPPCNSFCRLLAHKLADYYALTHFVDNAVSSVRLYRTPYCRLPTPLNLLTTEPTHVDNNVSSAQPAMKIMRRAGMEKEGQHSSPGVDATEDSLVPSKAGSETGEDSQQGTGLTSPTNSNLAKEKSTMTREEREAKYKETRERIFGPESEHAENNEITNEISRTSSRNERKKKKHKNNDDGFEARSQFNVYYPAMQYPISTYDQPTAPPMYWSPYAAQPGNMSNQTVAANPMMSQQFYQQAYPSMINSQPFPSALGNGPTMANYDVPNTTNYFYTQQMPLPIFPQPQHGGGMGQQSPAISSPALSTNGHFPGPQSQLSDQQWPQSSYVYPYHQSKDQQQFFPLPAQSANPMGGVQSVPYQYGQLPSHPAIQGARSQHPLPGSYKGQSFNPQTRAFIPNGGPVHQPMAHQGNSPNHSSSRSPAISHLASSQYPAFGQQVLDYPSLGPLPVPSSFNFGQESKNYGPRKTSSQSHATSQSPVQSSLSKWGTPSHLPPKPPPPEAPSMPEGQNALPANIQAMSGGQPMPSFHNGIYSLPGSSQQTTS